MTTFFLLALTFSCLSPLHGELDSQASHRSCFVDNSGVNIEDFALEDDICTKDTKTLRFVTLLPFIFVSLLDAWIVQKSFVLPLLFVSTSVDL